MTDLTPIFNKCVEIVAKELPLLLLNQSKNTDPLPYLVNDSFTKDCHEVYNNLIRLAAFVSQIKPLYLQNNDELSKYERDSKRLSAEEKNGIDEEFRIKIHQINEKLKFFRTYENRRNELASSQKKTFGGFLSLFGDEQDDNASLYNQTLSTHRAQMIIFLNTTTHKCNSSFEKMQRQRYERERQLNLLHFQNLDDSEDLDVYNNFKSEFKMEVSENTSSGDSGTGQLTQELLQELTQENQDLLLSKENQFKQVEKLHTSMLDIIKLQSELTAHLETQGEQIGNLIDNQELVELDLRQGNRTLTKATDRNKRGSNFIVATCIALGFLLLLLDYIS
ncbi:hypothetical protein PUMCH_003301 [Australozyma saopauloensis]|uniref:t-SNARE coiled-coil homology domain-containing protein n=1 Tax=Australozyma saopauloensis TaxID=291208 RepID=A0AAX4HC16_9ASCO|nr:hypothetical protein PUMCH_003301 [[Candida] saopauloensis]